MLWLALMLHVTVWAPAIYLLHRWNVQVHVGSVPAILDRESPTRPDDWAGFF